MYEDQLFVLFVFGFWFFLKSVHKFYRELGLGNSEDLLSGSFLEGSSK